MESNRICGSKPTKSLRGNTRKAIGSASIRKVIGFVVVNQQRVLVVEHETNEESSVGGSICKVIGFVEVNQQRDFVVAHESNEESSVGAVYGK